jgi:hypothetical protein
MKWARITGRGVTQPKRIEVEKEEDGKSYKYKNTCLNGFEVTQPRPSHPTFLAHAWS